MKEQKHSYSQRNGKTTFIVNVKQSESAKKPLHTVFQDICKQRGFGWLLYGQIAKFRKSIKSILTNLIPKEINIKLMIMSYLSYSQIKIGYQKE